MSGPLLPNHLITMSIASTNQFEIGDKNQFEIGDNSVLDSCSCVNVEMVV